jgi:hypothetical protein
MEIVVDLDASTAVLAAPNDFARFAVRVVRPAAGPVPEAGEPRGVAPRVVPGSAPGVMPGLADRERLAEVVASTGVGAVGGTGDVFVRPEAVRALADGSAGEAWASGFAAMCEYAASKGWVDGAGRIQAHVEWPPPES